MLQIKKSTVLKTLVSNRLLIGVHDVSNGELSKVEAQPVIVGNLQYFKIKTPSYPYAFSDSESLFLFKDKKSMTFVLNIFVEGGNFQETNTDSVRLKLEE